MSLIDYQLRLPNLPAEKITDLARRREHVWRDFWDQPPGFASLPRQDLSALKRFSREQKKWEYVLMLGIGGSSLGGRTLVESLAKSKVNFYFLDNLDPLETSATLKKINLKKTLVVVISKSGNTLETLSSFFLVKEKLGRNWAKQTVVVTDPDTGYLRKLAKREKLMSFDVPKDVGGRYSVLSPVGLVPAALAGVNIGELLAGAKSVDLRDAFLFALVQAELYRQGKTITVFCPYANSLKKLGEWYGQLLAESIGKNPEIGITPEASLGATDQHSKLQLWLAGPPDKFFIFLGVENFGVDLKIKNAPKNFDYLKNKSLTDILNAELAGTVEALGEHHRPLSIFTLRDISARTLGWLFYFFQLEVAFLGHILGVNPYDQPGVERGKELTKKRLEG